MSDTNENKTENNIPDFPNVLRNLFEQVRNQAESQRRRVRINEEKSQSEERKNSDDTDETEDHDGESHKWDILLDLADSHKMLCRAFVELLDSSEE